jgi:hypothetical protein
MLAEGNKNTGLSMHSRWNLVCVALLMMALTTSGYANISIYASVSASKVYTGDRIKYTAEVVSFTNTPLPDLQLPSFSPFLVIGGPTFSNSQNVSIINGRRTSQISRKYTVDLQVPSTPGTYIISASTGGGQQSRPVKVIVVDDGAIMPAMVKEEGLSNPYTHPTNSALDREFKGKIFLRPIISKESVYKREALKIDWYLYKEISPSMNRVRFIDLKSGWVDIPKDTFMEFVYQPGLSDLDAEKEVVGDSSFIKYKISSALFYPQTENDLLIDTYQIQLTIPVRSKNTFLNPLFMDGLRLVVPSKTIDVPVKDLPLSGRPPDFQGAVGDLDLEVEVDRTEALQGEDLITLRLTVSGTGYINAIPAPVIPELNGFNIFEEPTLIETSAHYSEQAGEIEGFRTWEVILRAENAGKLNIPQICYPYFNPLLEKYENSCSDPITLTIQRNQEYDDLIASRVANSANTQNQTTTAQLSINKELEYINTSPLATQRVIVEKSVSPYVFALGGFSTFFFLLGMVWRPSTHQVDQAVVRQSKALKIALQQLSKIGKLDGADYIGQLDRIIRGYIADKSGRSVEGLDIDEVNQLIENFTNDDSISQEYTQVLDTLSTVAYAPDLLDDPNIEVENIKSLLLNTERHWGSENV